MAELPGLIVCQLLAPGPLFANSSSDKSGGRGVKRLVVRNSRKRCTGHAIFRRPWPELSRAAAPVARSQVGKVIRQLEWWLRR